MLKIDIRPGEAIAIGSHAVIRLEEKSGKIARLAIEADKSIPVSRISRHQTPAQLAAAEGITGTK